MTALDTVLERFDASKEKVRQEIREEFFKPDGTLAVTEMELRAWIADRAVDELRVVLELAQVLAHSAHLIPASILTQITEQAADEVRHYCILRDLVPAELHPYIDGKVAVLPADLAANEHWSALLAAVRDGNPFAALLDINIVHEGYSVAAIEELSGIPFADIREAYARIGADEEKHHESGREMLEWLVRGAETHGPIGNVTSAVVATAHERAVPGGALSWSWP